MTYDKNVIPELPHYDEITLHKWLIPGEFRDIFENVKDQTVVSQDRLWNLWELSNICLHIEGEFWECGVYKGGSGKLLSKVAKKKNKTIRLFDTFEGMPDVNPDIDFHHAGDFDDVQFNHIKNFIGRDDHIEYMQGIIPATFDGLDDCKIAFAHIDVDIYQSVKDCLEFIWPRLTFGGIVVADDYGFATCLGAKKAFDEFCMDMNLSMFYSRTGQGILFKNTK